MKITSEHSVTLLGIKIDNQLKFDNHVSTLCKKAGSQRNAIGRLRKYIGFPGKKEQIQTRMERKASDHWDLRSGILYQNT